MMSLQLARLAEAANLRRELHAVLDRLIDQLLQAQLALWFQENGGGDILPSMRMSEEEAREHDIA